MTVRPHPDPDPDPDPADVPSPEPGRRHPHRPFRPHRLWLLAPFVLYLGALPFVNRVQPVVLGLPFLVVWLLAATVLTPVAVGLAHRGDRRQAATAAVTAAQEQPHPPAQGDGERE